MSINTFLNRIEHIGNRLPHPTALFIWLALIIVLLSAVSAWLGTAVDHPVSGELVSAKNLISTEGLHWMLTNTVKNFVNFAPVGTVLVAILGIGVAEHSGLLAALIKATVLKAPAQLLTFVVVMAGVLSSLAADTGYVILIPLAALVFKQVGRNPLTGIAAAFAGVSGGFSANLLVGPVDAILAGISTEAAALIDPAYTVNAAGNYYFLVISTIIISVVVTVVTEKLVAGRLEQETEEVDADISLSTDEARGLKVAGYFSLAFIALLLWGLLPEQGILRDPATNSVLRSPFIAGIVTIVAIYAGLCGVIFGKVSGNYQRAEQAIEGMEQQMGTMASYLVLMFFAAQFVNYFAWSNLGSIFAINGAALLQSMQPPSTLLLVLFILVAATINLLIGSASAKWALIAPIFVPMLMLNGISPEAAQIAYRIGDSSTNIITPLMPYFGVVVAFAQQYRKDFGIGTMAAMMIPYSVALLMVWSALLILWILLGLPLGPGSEVYYTLPEAVR